MSAAKDVFHAATEVILRLMTLLLSGARERPPRFTTNLRLPVDGTGRNFARLAVDFDGDPGGIAEHGAILTLTV
jgi:hypothetical protein